MGRRFKSFPQFNCTAFTMSERADQRICFFFPPNHRIVQVCQHLYSQIRLRLVFPKAKIAVEREEIWECDGHTVHKPSQRRLTADWLALREIDCLRIHSKVSSNWLPNYIKCIRPVLEIFKMAGYFPDSPRVCVCVCVYIYIYIYN
jgi:hypothetical protein